MGSSIVVSRRSLEEKGSFLEFDEVSFVPSDANSSIGRRKLNETKTEPLNDTVNSISQSREKKLA